MSIEIYCVSRLGNAAVKRPCEAENVPRGTVWVGGWVGGWMGGWVGGWMGGWVDGWMGGWVDGWVGGFC